MLVITSNRGNLNQNSNELLSSNNSESNIYTYLLYLHIYKLEGKTIGENDVVKMNSHPLLQGVKTVLEGIL